MSKDVKSFVASLVLYQSVKSSVTSTFLHSCPSLRCCLLSPSPLPPGCPYNGFNLPGHPVAATNRSSKMQIWCLIHSWRKWFLEIIPVLKQFVHSGWLMLFLHFFGCGIKKQSLLWWQYPAFSSYEFAAITPSLRSLDGESSRTQSVDFCWDWIHVFNPALISITYERKFQSFKKTMGIELLNTCLEKTESLSCSRTFFTSAFPARGAKFGPLAVKAPGYLREMSYS